MRRLLTPIMLVALFGPAPSCAGESEGDIEKVTYEELASWLEGGEAMTVVDVRPLVDYQGGHIQDAISVDLADLVDDAGQLIDGGSALTGAVPDKSTRLVLYCWGYGNDGDFAAVAQELGYTNVYRYDWGVEQWALYDYLVIEYESFKKWHEANYPFEDGDNFLIDDLPEPWYTGEDPAHPGGHIPGAVNIPIDQWGNNLGAVDGGTAFTDVVTDKSAKVVIYCGDSMCGKSLVGVKAALELGYTNVFRYEGGWQEWQDKGNELKPGQAP